ncbi:MAG: V-type ATP synthase subunit D [Candidatus Aegiribacteria sp.]|nr:V-type ATP synthase subunit D [Candidatus Aegiribacteria sp.]
MSDFEYVIIPEIKQAIRYIRLKLDKMERGSEN